MTKNINNLMIPKITGFEVAKRLKGDETTIGIPILVLTSLGQDQNIRLASELGIDDYMIKPFSPTLLSFKVKRYLGI